MHLTPNHMKCLLGSRFFELLDDALCPKDSSRERVQCWGDFRVSRPILLNRGFKEQEGWEGLVLQLALWEQGGSPASYEAYRPGYVWKPYRGEPHS